MRRARRDASTATGDASRDDDAEDETNEDKGRGRGDVVAIATSRDKGETWLDAHVAKALGADDGEATAGKTANGGGVSARRVLSATRARDRAKETRKSGGLLTRAVLNALTRKHGAPTSSWGSFLRAKQRAMQRLPPGTASAIRLSSTRNIRLEHERVSFSHPVRSIGRRRAVLVGVNYECFDGDGTRERELEQWRIRRRGGDATRMREYLRAHCGYDDDDDVRVLVDDGDVDAKACKVSRSCGKKDVLDACRWLVADARAGDSLFFYFSGREVEPGDRKSKNPPKGVDKTALCVADTPLDEKNRITRRELREALVDTLPEGVRLTLFLDILGGGGEHALYLPYSCVNILLPDEKDIKDAKNGKSITPLTPLWMVPDGDAAVREFLACSESTASLFRAQNQAFLSVKKKMDVIQSVLEDGERVAEAKPRKQVDANATVAKAPPKAPPSKAPPPKAPSPPPITNEEALKDAVSVEKALEATEHSPMEAAIARDVEDRPVAAARENEAEKSASKPPPEIAQGGNETSRAQQAPPTAFARSTSVSSIKGETRSKQEAPPKAEAPPSCCVVS